MDATDVFSAILCILCLACLGLVIWGIANQANIETVCRAFGYTYEYIEPNRYCMKIVGGVAEYVPWAEFKVLLNK